MTDLPNDIESLKLRVLKLLEENAKLKAENAEQRHRLDLNSHNSHKPPSSDGYLKKSVKPGLPKAGKVKGGQQSLAGKTLKRVENPDQVMTHLPEQCACCGRAFATDEAHVLVQSRQVFDMPDPKLDVTEHRVGIVTCCGIEQRGVYPTPVTATEQYGPGVRAWVTKLSVDHKMPLEQIGQLFVDSDSYDLNTTTIEEALERAYALSGATGMVVS